MYLIKQKPEDFIVREVIDLPLEPSGDYTYFLLKKRNYTTFRAIDTVARVLKVSSRDIGYAGLKDKTAVTEQFCSVFHLSKDRLENIQLPDIELKFVGYGKDQIYLGMHCSNSFEIVVRNISALPTVKNKFVNFFGIQRFQGTNAQIGKAILQRRFNDAVELVNTQHVDLNLTKFLEEHPRDYVGALKCAPFKLLKLYLSAYQSYIWNEVARITVEKNQSPKQIVVPGFGIDIDATTTELLAKDNITTANFVIKEIPDLSCEGFVRSLFEEAKNILIENPEPDDLHVGMMKSKVSFSLNAGSYATEFISQLFDGNSKSR